MRQILALDLGKFKTATCLLTDDVSEVLVAHPGGEAWQWGKVKRKTDKDDALKLAKMARNHEITSVHIPSPEHRQFQQLVRYRKKLQSQRTATQNAIRSNLMAQGKECAGGKIAWSKKYIESEFEQLRKPFTECVPQEYWRGTLDIQLTNLVETMKLLRKLEKQLASISSADPRIAIVESIPGVGAIGAQVIVAHVDDATRFKNARQVSSYAGLVPKKWQSGQVDRQNRISKRGPRLLRSVLTEVAWCAIRYNSQFKALYDRVRGGSKSRKKQAITAVARKILVIAWAMLRDGTIWQPLVPTSAQGPPGQAVPASTA